MPMPNLTFSTCPHPHLDDTCPTRRAVSGAQTGDRGKAKGGEGSAAACMDASALDAASELPARAKGEGAGLEGGQSAAYGVGELGGMLRGGVGVPLVPLRKGKIGSHVSDALVFSHGLARELEARSEVLVVSRVVAVCCA